MGWKSVAWASCLLPVLAGCGTVRNLTTGTQPVPAQYGGEHDLRQDAQAAWQGVREQHPQRTFTDEFHDGFLDGYADCRDRGVAAKPPTTPPFKYLCGQGIFHDRRALPPSRLLFWLPVWDDSCRAHTAPENSRLAPTTPVVPLPKSPAGMPPPKPVPENKIGPPKKSDDPIPQSVRPPLQTSPGPGVSPSPKSQLPVIPPFNPNLSGGKFDPLPVPKGSDLLPVPNPPLPSIPIQPVPVPRDEPAVTMPPVLGSAPIMPIPVPTNGPMPSILDDFPVIPFKFTMPASDTGQRANPAEVNPAARSSRILLACLPSQPNLPRPNRPRMPGRGGLCATGCARCARSAGSS